MPYTRAPYRAFLGFAWHADCMTRVNLVGPAEDGLHLLVETDGGEQYSLAITDELRHAVRYARPKPSYDDSDDGRDALTPKEIQQRIRAGLTAAELSELTGEPVEQLEKFEPPVIAERAYVAELARTTRIGRDPSAPVLGELVVDRLAGRGVDTDEIVWDAWREVDEPWQVAVDFAADTRRVRAQWTFDHSSRTLTAEDDDARWLTETELLDVPIPRRHLAAVPSAEDDVTPLPEHRPAMPAAVEAVVDDDDDADDGLTKRPTPPSRSLKTSRRAVEAARRSSMKTKKTTMTARPSRDSGPPRKGLRTLGLAPPCRTPQVPLAVTTTRPRPSPNRHHRQESDDADPPTREVEAVDKPSRRGRASVPSWDEIVFGARHDQG